MSEALTSATTVSSMPPTAPSFRPVPKIASTISVHCEISEKCSSQLCSSLISTTVTPSRPRISRLVRASPRTSRERADHEHRRVDAALQQRPRDHEAVAAVVAAAAQDGDAAVELRLVGRLHRRHHLAAGVLHQHERRNADVFDREAVGLAHLRGVEDSHQAGYGSSPPCTCAQAVTLAFCMAARSMSTDASPASATRSSRSSITASSTAKASTRRCARIDGRPFLYDRHMRRLRRSAELIDAAAPVQRRASSPRRSGRRMAAAGFAGEAYIRVLVTRGIGDLTYDPKATPDPVGRHHRQAARRSAAGGLSTTASASSSSTSSAIIPRRSTR